MDAVDNWRRLLQGLAIPDAILAAAAESPYVHPVEMFRRRGRAALAGREPPSTSRALEALPAGGCVVDVGVGGGAASLPLAGRASLITGVDDSAEMLSAFAETAALSGAKIRTIEGRWPDVEAQAPVADVVVCHHVLYNVSEIEPFVKALSSHARVRVVVEIPDRHPWAWMSDLWTIFHGIVREDPTADDAQAALEQLGLHPEREDHSRPWTVAVESREQAVVMLRKRLCLDPDRDEDVARALGSRLSQEDGLWVAGPPRQSLVTLWWDQPVLETS